MIKRLTELRPPNVSAALRVARRDDIWVRLEPITRGPISGGFRLNVSLWDQDSREWYTLPGSDTAFLDYSRAEAFAKILDQNDLTLDEDFPLCDVCDEPAFDECRLVHAPHVLTCSDQCASVADAGLTGYEEPT